MTVKDVFDLRRQGRIEEAYEAIRPMYAAHKGRYTTLCMFWTASDVFKLRMDEGRTDEAEKICLALQRMLPRVQEIERQLQEERGITGENTPSGSAQFFVDYARKRLEKAHTAILDNNHESHFFDEHESHELNEYSLESCSEEKSDSCSEGKEQEFSIVNSQLSILNAPQQVVDVKNIKGLNPMQRIVLGFIAANPGNEIPSISYGLGISAKIVESQISVLLARNLIEHRDTPKDGGYHVK